ncbi:helix-turn-helix transcriptional regulator [Rhizobium sp. L1K21]|uniref:ArsR/SmtB family transcription factor n=1 Tax=Rhizobium sp. L1K21 TaxID=2954933 RepID=UPI002091EAA5|nr:winged helix-turn-helix domain-containing protein [Rhizobium sp. L1K21]MCO6186817.1 winged helix-turn-helix domain-containing protein [Rhizobium sp. L1K21]
MKEGPDISQTAALVGDPARANMLVALMDGRALTASELSAAAGITQQTASSHLARLEAGRFVIVRKQGRHKYFALTEPAGELLEGLFRFSAETQQKRLLGPKDPALRKARICYDHMAGDYGVQMFENLKARRFICEDGDAVDVTPSGENWLEGLGIDIGGLRKLRRPLCRSCLDWSERRSHLAGALGASLLDLLLDKGYARRMPESRVIAFTSTGERRFAELFGV